MPQRAVRSRAPCGFCLPAPCPHTHRLMPAPRHGRPVRAEPVLRRRRAAIAARSPRTVLADAGNRVVLHARRPELAEAINTTRDNPRYLPGIHLRESLTATTDIAKAIDGAEVLMVSIPAQTLRDNHIHGLR
ncbi:hypothetical protein [Streptomyces sp. NPDC059979]|uniref:hypothetical protein n=1 Tax=Streptomyces sp. NPDC059979 TaxID=3347021 RepID=UPI0036CF6154